MPLLFLSEFQYNMAVERYEWNKLQGEYACIVVLFIHALLYHKVLENVQQSHQNYHGIFLNAAHGIYTITSN